MVVLYRNDTFSMSVLSTKKPYSSFLKKIFVIQKIYFKVEVLKTFKVFSDGHMKMKKVRSSQAAILVPN